ncbi:hypothetical protein [Cytobacillus horneckiae]|uniref:hypothetical protein n=1 Tax=Cytobacillus horneckiae TaxID=549687 RepID=UPI003D1AB30F
MAKKKKIILIIMSCSSVVFTGILIYLASIEGISNTILKEVVSGISDEEIELLTSDPSVQKLMNEHTEDLRSINLKDTNLPIKTKEQAVKKLSSDFSMEEIREISSKIKNGMSTDEQSEIFNMLTERLTEEELTAIKVIAVQEMMKR